MQPITTIYKGYRFRSRLEARWAVFFETLGLDWAYEPEGFDLGGTQYLPDFRVTAGEITYWYEIKPLLAEPCKKFDLFAKLVITGNTEACLVLGDPFDVFMEKDVCPRCGKYESPEMFHTYSNGLTDLGFSCHDCDEVTPSGGDNPPEIGFAGVEYWPHKGWILITESNYQIGRAHV
mgnify:CR=1 FL=1